MFYLAMDENNDENCPSKPRNNLSGLYLEAKAAIVIYSSVRVQ